MHWCCIRIIGFLGAKFRTLAVLCLFEMEMLIGIEVVENCYEFVMLIELWGCAWIIKSLVLLDSSAGIIQL